MCACRVTKGGRWISRGAEMGKASKGWLRAWAAILLPVSLLLPSCMPTNVKEKTFSLVLNGHTYRDLISSVETFSRDNQMSMSISHMPGPSPSSTSSVLVSDGNGVRVLVQNALLEQCEEKEGRRDVEYSHNVFDVNLFSTSLFKTEERFEDEFLDFQRKLVAEGFVITDKSGSCKFL